MLLQIILTHSLKRKRRYIRKGRFSSFNEYCIIQLIATSRRQSWWSHFFVFDLQTGSVDFLPFLNMDGYPYFTISLAVYWLSDTVHVKQYSTQKLVLQNEIDKLKVC